jgi:hypothetical protein
LPATIDRIVHHQSIDIIIVVRLSSSAAATEQRTRDATAHLKNSFFDVYSDTLAVHTFPCLSDQPQLKVDADRLARFLGELLLQYSVRKG